MIKKSFLFGKKKYSHFDRLFSGRDGLWDFDGECRVSVRMVSNYQYVFYTGSLQMLMVSFLVNQIPLMTVAVTALLLNSRHIFTVYLLLKSSENMGSGNIFDLWSDR